MTEDNLKSIEEEPEPKNYWIARMTDRRNPCGWEDLYTLASKGNVYIAQYRYGENGEDEVGRKKQSAIGKVTIFLKAVKEVEPNDVLLLTNEGRIYAYGRVDEHPYNEENAHVSSIDRVIKKGKNEFDDGIICYEDSKVFYEDLNVRPRGYWRQLIKVKGWLYGAKIDEGTSVTTKDVTKDNVVWGCYRDTLFKVKPEFAEGKMEELRQQYKNRHKDE